MFGEIKVWQVLCTPLKIFLNKNLNLACVAMIKKEVDEFLDDIIKDYETNISTIGRNCVKKIRA